MRKFSDWRAWSLASRSWTWAAGPEPLRSRPNGMSGRPARCMGSMRRRRCLREQADKARKAGVEVVFKNGLAQALPFPNAQFDAVLSTVMLHHLPRKARLECACEMRRVLKPRGRVLVVDFGGAAEEKRLPRALSPPWSRQAARHHWHAKRSGFEHCRERCGGTPRLAFCSRDGPIAARNYEHRNEQADTMMGHRRLLTRPWILLVAAAILIGHGIVLYYISSNTSLSVGVLASVIILVVIKHLGLLAPLFALFRRRG